MYQGNPVGVELLCKHFRWVYVTHILFRNLGGRSETTFPSVIYSVGSSADICGGQEGTQNAAKLQLSVHTNSRTHFLKTCLQRFKCHQHCLRTLTTCPLQSSISYLEKSYTFREDMSARFFDAINTDF